MSDLICSALSGLGFKPSSCQKKPEELAVAVKEAPKEDPQARSFLEKLLFGAETEGVVGCKKRGKEPSPEVPNRPQPSIVPEAESKTGITSKPTWELTEEESKALQGLLKNIYEEVLDEDLVKISGPPLFYEVTIYTIKEKEGYKKLPQPIKSLGALIGEYSYYTKSEEIKQKLSRKIKSNQAGWEGKLLRISQFEIEIKSHGRSIYGPSYYLVSIIPHTIEIVSGAEQKSSISFRDAFQKANEIARKWRPDSTLIDALAEHVVYSRGTKVVEESLKGIEHGNLAFNITELLTEDPKQEPKFLTWLFVFKGGNQYLSIHVSSTEANAEFKAALPESDKAPLGKWKIGVEEAITIAEKAGAEKSGGLFWLRTRKINGKDIPVWSLPYNFPPLKWLLLVRADNGQILVPEHGKESILNRSLKGVRIPDSPEPNWVPLEK